MSKEADKDLLDEAAPGEAGGKRRRRRKRTGLRVPSDNVPRRADADVGAPAADDTDLAVSVAYRFASETEVAVTADGSQRASSMSEEVALPPLGSGEIDTRPTQRMPSVNFDIGDDDAHSRSGEFRVRDGYENGDAEPRTAPRAESVEVSIEEELPDADADADANDDFEALEHELETTPVTPVRVTRAATVVLSDDDLEELRDDDHGALRRYEAFRGRARQPSGADEAGGGTGTAEPFDHEEYEAYGYDDEAAEVREPWQAPSGEPPEAAAPPIAAVPAAVAAVEEALEQSAREEPSERVEPADAGDSGEIIADDLIEEVDEALPSSPPPMPGAATGAREPRLSPSKPPPAPKAAPLREVASPGEVAGRRRKSKPWFEEVFDEDYLRTLPFLTPKATQAEARFVCDSLELEAGGQVLDVGCGYGRHAMELAARGYHVAALDSSLPLLLRGADEAQRRGLNINFVHGDMRELGFEAQFDGAYCLFSTFGYFDDETNKKAAQGIARALQPGGRFVVEVLNRDYLIADLPSRVWWEGDGCVVLEEVEFNYFSSRIVSSRSVVFDDGRQLEQEISLRSYSLHELGKLLHAAGFRVLEISGSMSTRGRFFGAQSRSIIVLAEKRAARDERAATES